MEELIAGIFWIVVGFFIYRWWKKKKAKKQHTEANPSAQYESPAQQTTLPSTANTSAPVNDKAVMVNKSPLPLDVFELLWFSDGKYQNYDPQSAGKSYNSDYGISFTMTFSGNIEPSAISLSMPIAKPKNLLFVEALPYFPTYFGMNPEQRYIYLSWLANIDSLVDTGYVFVFYYGLERHLFSDEYEKAFKMIIRLRKHHKNGSFLSYSANALLASLLFHKRADLFGEYLTNSDEMVVSEFYLYIKLLLEQPLFAEEIISQASTVGFTNKRYIKSDYDLFSSILKEKIKAKFGEEFIAWSNFDMSKCQTRKINIAANTSLSPREIAIPDLLTNRELSKTLLELLNDTHESVKEALKEQRKKDK